MDINRNTTGVFTIAPTPFLPDGSIDTASLDKMVDYYEEVGVIGITLLGQMGEAPKLDANEAAELIKRVISRSSVPVVVGVSAGGFASMRALSHTAMDAGAAGVMVAPPSNLRTDDQIVNYYANVSSTIGLATPFILQDFPLSTSVVITPEVIRKIVVNFENCVALKHEDWPGLEKISALRNFEKEGKMPQISILCGFAGAFLDFELERGADGAMTGYCFPEMLVGVARLSAQGDRAGAHDLFDAHLPLVRYEQQPMLGLAVRKYVMALRGIIAHDTQRTPHSALSDTAKAEVDYLISRLAQHDPVAQLQA